MSLPVRAEATPSSTIAVLHEDWRAAWGETLAGEALRSEIEANPRLQSRLLEQIAEAHGASFDTRPDLTRTAGKVADILAVDRTGFLRLCGLAHIGRRLAMATNRDDYLALARSFGQNHLAAAVRIAADMPEEIDTRGFDSEQLVQLADRMGTVALREWITTLPKPSADWIRMLLPRERDRKGSDMSTTRAVALVEGAAKHWVPSESATEDRPVRYERSRRRGR